MGVYGRSGHEGDIMLSGSSAEQQGDAELIGHFSSLIVMEW
jgi:hypothetical protein